MLKESLSVFPAHGELAAIANVKGSTLNRSIRGVVRFYHAANGTVVQAEIEGMPTYKAAAPPSNQPIGAFFGFHIHENQNCGMDGSHAGGHYNPTMQPHGNHAGDLPPLLENNGKALMSVYTNRFRPSDVVGRTVMIHENPDDFRTQPSGNSGARIACGTIVMV